MKKHLSIFLQAILFITGLLPFLINCIHKNKVSEVVINRINIWCYDLNWWGKR